MFTILIVEDNKMNSDMLARRLHRHGFATIVAEDGPSGVEKATTEKPDLILMDVALGAMDGWEATTLIRKDARSTHIPIIALTAHALSSDRAMSIHVGCNDFDTKPVDMPRLLEKIARCLGTSNQSVDSASDLAQRPSLTDLATIDVASAALV